MQKEKENTALPRIPEHYLYQAYQHHQKLKKPLLTAEGQPLEIVECGLRNPDNGPDFKDALLKVGGVLVRGDVEFHLCWQDWFRHGHNDDSRYRQVILHGLWQPPQGLPGTLSQRFPHLVISSW